MVIKYPITENDLRLKRPDVPQSEITFYNLIDDLDKNWIVWHSVEWMNESQMKVGEADFLIFNYNYGFLVIEVKGGIIIYENDMYYTINQKTKIKKNIQDPFYQARKSTFFFRDYYIRKASLEENPRDLLQYEGYKVKFPLNYNYGVFFPYTFFKEEYNKSTGSVRNPFEKIFDKSDCIQQENWRIQKKNGILNSSPLEDFFINLLKIFPKSSVRYSKLKDYFPRLISPDVKTAFQLNHYLDDRENELNYVNETQVNILKSLDGKSHCIFKGSAGSGKTFMAIKKAIMNYEEGKSTLFLCFNKELREFLYKFFLKKFEKIDRIWYKKICVYSINLFLSIVAEKLFLFDKIKQLKEEIFSFKYKSIVNEIINSKETSKFINSFKFDALLIDEAQDMNENLWGLFIDFLKDSIKSIYYIFFDPEQAIFVKNFTPNRFGLDVNSDLILLDRNIRNTIQIAKWIKNKTTYGNYKEFSGIDGFEIDDGHQFESPVDALNFIINEIKDKYLKSEIDPERIVLLSYHTLKSLYPKIRSNDLCNYFWFKNEEEKKFNSMFIVEPKNIKDVPKIKQLLNKWVFLFETISSFKGLERDIIFLLVPKIDIFKKYFPDDFNYFKMQIYVGASRAKFKLYFIEYKPLYI